ncbi:helical backbone metal receptor [uncultured Thermanaerothrix sp.]|uniref:helical backbone metal receptor n=1 Tax=uncultured Thermanaerothrix sp. TaxID=1195149 RepID=UPI00261115DE|nr:helical backbone metal receptor [uncultured Thermanaerothrix sp.]
MRGKDLASLRTPPVFDVPPRRVVSLVPSITESIVRLGLGDVLVGVTDYCIYPEGLLDAYPRVGGTKNVRVAEVIALQPDLIIASQEENTPEVIWALVKAEQRVWVTFPKTVREALADLWKLMHLFARDHAFQALRVLERSVEIAELADDERPKVRYFCPIWEEEHPRYGRWWMTFNRETYSSDLLRIAGGENVFAGRERRYPLEAELGETLGEPPGERDVRYPRVSLEEVLRADPEIILVPSEPYPYRLEDCQRLAEIFAETSAAQNGRIYYVEGSLITWPGVRMGEALAQLPPLFEMTA